MGPTEVVADANVACSAERIFELIADLRGQDAWLSKSSAYRGTADISTERAQLGTTYREPGPAGVRHGEVVEFEPPKAIAFHQPMTLRFGLGRIEILMRYTLTPTSDPAVTHVRRAVELSVAGLLSAAQPLIARSVAVESRRTLLALKEHADSNVR